MDEHEKLKEAVIIAAKAWASWCASTDDEWKVALEEAVVALETFEEDNEIF